jgi:hypothetical protein
VNLYKVTISGDRNMIDPPQLFYVAAMRIENVPKILLGRVYGALPIDSIESVYCSGFYHEDVDT